MVDGSGLENRQGESPRGFESHPLRFRFFKLTMALRREQPCQRRRGTIKVRGICEILKLPLRDSVLPLMRIVGGKSFPGQPHEITVLQDVIASMHESGSKYLRTEFVRELFNDEIPWDGLVRVFRMNDSKDSHCYAWSYRDGVETKHIALLESSQINSANAAVKAVRAGLR